MDNITLFLKDGKTVYRPGETIRGELLWDLREDVQDITINIFWYTDGVGEQDSEIAVSEKISMPLQKGRQSFEMELPAAPYSYKGRITELQWAIEATTMKDKVKDVKEFSMTPDKREIVLPEIKEETSGIQKFLQSFGKKRS